MWSGSTATIPAGWALCNGSNGTPDLRDRFIVGAGGSYAVGATGGSADAVVVAHTHTGTTATDGNHAHGTFNMKLNDDGGFSQPGSFTDYLRIRSASGTTESAGAHNHSFTTNSAGSSGTNANLPPYFALAYIMKL